MFKKQIKMQNKYQKFSEYMINLIQIRLKKISQLKEHLNINKKDFSAKRALNQEVHSLKRDKKYFERKKLINNIKNA
ncbi:hypothetical protein AB837_00091 [bacterium AB1]|nr:hypothetical protein AB837_00091 [bacterium AB1]